MLAGGERIGLVYTWFAVIDERNRIRSKVPGRHIDGDVMQFALMGNLHWEREFPTHSTPCFGKVGGYDSALRNAGAQGCEDMQIYYRIARKFHFGLVPEHLTGYRVEHDRMSSDRLRMFRSFRMVADEMKLDIPSPQKKSMWVFAITLQFLIGEALAVSQFQTSSVSTFLNGFKSQVGTNCHSRFSATAKNFLAWWKSPVAVAMGRSGPNRSQYRSREATQSFRLEI